MARRKRKPKTRKPPTPETNTVEDPGNWPPVQEHTKKARVRAGKPILLQWYREIKHGQRFLNYGHLKAAGQIRRAFELITEEVGAKSPSLIRVTGGKGIKASPSWTEDQIDCVSFYREWLTKMDENKIKVAPVLNVIVDEKPVTKVASKGRKYYTLKEIIKRSLNLYMEIRGPEFV